MTLSSSGFGVNPSTSLGELRFTDAYHLIPATGDGTAGTNFYRTTYTHDTDTGRLYKTEHPDGTISWTEIDELGRSKEAWRGTDSAAATLGGLPAGDMKLVSRVYYDDGDCANFIEAHTSVQHNDVALMLDGNRVNSLSVGELREICSMFDHPLRDYDSGFEVPSIGLTIYCHLYENDKSSIDAVAVIPPE